MSKGNGEIEYTEKVNKILNALEEGVSRKELAEEMDYSEWKCLDIYMRRKGFRFNEGEYVPAEEVAEEENDDKEDNDSKPEEDKNKIPEHVDSKIHLVTGLLDNGVQDITKAAERAGFESTDELAEYMEERGFAWDSTERNYVFKDENYEGGFEGEEEETDEKIDLESREISSNNNGNLNDITTELLQFLPLLNMLSEHEDELEEILKEEQESPPRYTIPGKAGQKGVHISRKMIHLLEEYSDVKGLTQREIVEIALYEFMVKYGFEDEVKAVLVK